MKKTFSGAIAALLLGALALFGADVTGKWTAEVEGRNGEKRTNVFNLKADGEKLTGTVSGMGRNEREITDGKVKGDEITFTVKFTGGGQERVMNYTGKIVGDQINFKVEGGQRAREFTARRATS